MKLISKHAISLAIAVATSLVFVGASYGNELEVEPSVLRRFRSEIQSRRNPNMPELEIESVLEIHNSESSIDSGFGKDAREKALKRGHNLRNSVSTQRLVFKGRNVLKSEILPNGIERLLSKNSKYSFVITRKANSDDSFSLAGLAYGDIGNISPRDRQLMEAELRQIYIRAPGLWNFFTEPLSDFFAKNTVSIVGASERDGIVRVTFKDSGTEAGGACDGFVLLDTAKDWSVTELEVTYFRRTTDGLKPVTKKKMDFECQPVANGASYIVHKASLTTEWLNGSGDVDRVVYTNSILSDSVADDVFFLSHYGFLEPTREQATWHWFLAGFVALCIGYWIRRSRKYKRSSS